MFGTGPDRTGESAAGETFRPDPLSGNQTSAGSSARRSKETAVISPDSLSLSCPGSFFVSLILVSFRRGIIAYIGGNRMIVTVDQSSLEEAAAIHSVSWQESHRSFCSPEFIALHTTQHQKE